MSYLTSNNTRYKEQTRKLSNNDSTDTETETETDSETNTEANNTRCKEQTRKISNNDATDTEADTETDSETNTSTDTETDNEDIEADTKSNEMKTTDNESIHPEVFMDSFFQFATKTIDEQLIYNKYKLQFMDHQYIDIFRPCLIVACPIVPKYKSNDDGNPHTYNFKIKALSQITAKQTKAIKLISSDNAFDCEKNKQLSKYKDSLKYFHWDLPIIYIHYQNYKDAKEDFVKLKENYQLVRSIHVKFRFSCN